MKAIVKSVSEINTSNTGWTTCKSEFEYNGTVKKGKVFLGKQQTEAWFKVGDEIEFEEKESQYGLEFVCKKPNAGGGGKPQIGTNFKESREDWVMKNKSIIAQSSMSSAVEYMKHLPQEKVNGKTLVDIAEVMFNFVLAKSELK
jgi:hypothetical protein